jgi:hypothetical protein
MTQRIFLAALTAVAGSCLLLGCKSQSTETKIDAVWPVAPNPLTRACLEMPSQASHIVPSLATHAVLLDNNTTPINTLAGGQNGLGAWLVYALLSNSSVAQMTVKGHNDEALSSTQKAAALLPGLIAPLQHILFLPPLPALLNNAKDLAELKWMIRFADIFAGNPKELQPSLDALIGQFLLLADFAANASLSDALFETDLRLRNKIVFERWLEFSESILTGPQELFESVLWSPKKNLTATEDDKKRMKLKNRYFSLFARPDIAAGNPMKKFRADDPRSSLDAFERLLATLSDEVLGPSYNSAEAPLGKVVIDSHQESHPVLGKPWVLKSYELAKKETLGSAKLNQVLRNQLNSSGANFFVPSEKWVWNAYMGLQKNGKTLQIPVGFRLPANRSLAESVSDLMNSKKISDPKGTPDFQNEECSRVDFKYALKSMSKEMLAQSPTIRFLADFDINSESATSQKGARGAEQMVFYRANPAAVFLHVFQLNYSELANNERSNGNSKDNGKNKKNDSRKVGGLRPQDSSPLSRLRTSETIDTCPQISDCQRIVTTFF